MRFSIQLAAMMVAIILMMSGAVRSQTAISPSSDPCYNYSLVSDDWRSILGYSWNYMNDGAIDWTGWYRLYLNGKSAQLPESCVNYIRCGGYTPLYLNGSHPKVEEGVVTREVLGSSISQCGYYTSTPIQIKACPGEYYVYKLSKPNATIPYPVYCTVAYTKPSVDPCFNYTALDQPWRGTNTTYTGSAMCDRSIEFAGWYRLFYNGVSVRMPEYCVDWGMCSTDAPLWLNGPHPRLDEGVVVRQVCGSFGISDCCNYRSPPIQVKACPGNYYVYEFVKPPPCNYAYCADVSLIPFGMPMTLETMPTISYPKMLNVTDPGNIPSNSTPTFPVQYVLAARVKVNTSSNLTDTNNQEVFSQQLQDELRKMGISAKVRVKVKRVQKTSP